MSKNVLVGDNTDLKLEMDACSNPSLMSVLSPTWELLHVELFLLAMANPKTGASVPLVTCF